MMKRLFLLSLSAFATCIAADAASVRVEMNSTSRTMTFVDKTTGETVATGEAAKYIYEFEAPAGTYVLTGIASDGETVNGTIEINVTDVDEQQYFKVLTCTAYALNKNEDNTYWTMENGDFTLEVNLASRDGVPQVITVGNSITAARYTFLALDGSSYGVTFIPSDKHRDEGFLPAYKSGTLTWGANISCTLPMSGLLTVTVPDDADFVMGKKKSHFTDFSITEPVEEKTEDGKMVLTYRLAKGEQYNYRTDKEGGVTIVEYFKFNDSTADFDFNENDYSAYDPHHINHDVSSNNGFETGDIFVNGNERGHITLAPGETFKAHAMRSWQLTDNQVNNYFFEPDFHYTVLDIDGKPSAGVVEIVEKKGSAWADIKAVGNGTAIVLVTYDAIIDRSCAMGGQEWGAIWPENTAVYVVTVGLPVADISTGMLINDTLNDSAKKVSGKYVDAEHDTFYYLDTEEGFTYTFTPEGVCDVTIAYPEIGDRMATYKGFGREGVTKNDDGSYSLLLREGRQIVRMTDAAGYAAYQVLRARPCHREITNVSRPESTTFLPGDEVRIQYSGLFHPANKLAGIYNMSAYVTYTENPSGTSLILSPSQYTFGSSAKAQALSFTIPEDYDAAANPVYTLSEGCIQVNGYGDPIGNHRLINPETGRNANFTAIAHKTYFGAIPDVAIAVTGTGGVDNVGTDDDPTVVIVGYYNLQGVASQQPFEGLNIVRYSDGTAKKICIRK